MHKYMNRDCLLGKCRKISACKCILNTKKCDTNANLFYIGNKHKRIEYLNKNLIKINNHMIIQLNLYILDHVIPHHFFN